jgi:hypothetical protein
MREARAIVIPARLGTAASPDTPVCLMSDHACTESMLRYVAVFLARSELPIVTVIDASEGPRCTDPDTCTMLPGKLDENHFVPPSVVANKTVAPEASSSLPSTTLLRISLPSLRRWRLQFFSGTGYQRRSQQQRSSVGCCWLSARASLGAATPAEDRSAASETSNWCMMSSCADDARPR